MNPVDAEIWCDIHTCVHEETTDPYDYGYKLSGEEPECGPKDWHKLWIGRRLEK